MRESQEDHFSLSTSRCALKKGEPQRPLSTIPVVMFSDAINIHRIEYPTCEEAENRWYTNGEYFFFKKDALNTVRRMSSSNIKESDTVSTRGLEIVESKALKKRKEVISSAVQAVLNEKGAPPETIAQVYRNATMESVMKSIDAGASDAKDAERILMDVRKDLAKASKAKRKKDVMPLLSWLVKRQTKR